MAFKCLRQKLANNDNAVNKRSIEIPKWLLQRKTAIGANKYTELEIINVL